MVSGFVPLLRLESRVFVFSRICPGAFAEQVVEGWLVTPRVAALCATDPAF